MFHSHLDRFQSTRQGTLTLVKPLNQEDLDWCPPSGSWSIGEILDHLLRIESFYRGEIAELIRRCRPDGSAVLKRGSLEFDVTLRRLPRSVLPFLEFPLNLANLVTPYFFRSTLMKYPILPAQSPGWAQPQPGRVAFELREELQHSMAETMELFRECPDLDFTRLIHRHPFLGINNSLQLLDLMTLHEVRHQKQITSTLVARARSGPRRRPSP